MKVDTPNDLQGRLIRCQERAKMIGFALEAIGHSDLQDPDRDALEGFGAAALELADELRAIEEAYVDKANGGKTIMELACELVGPIR
jgi:hypothetical protein